MLSSWERDWIISDYPMTLIPPDDKTVNTYLPSELLREIFMYGIEDNQMKSGDESGRSRALTCIAVPKASGRPNPILVQAET
jgi:hypothetical protein